MVIKMQRIVLKLSGEALAGEKKTGFDEATVTAVAKQVKEIVDSGIQVSIVIGGGNFWRAEQVRLLTEPKQIYNRFLSPENPVYGKFSALSGF